MAFPIEQRTRDETMDADGLGWLDALSVVDAVLLRPLPIPEADRVVGLATRRMPSGGYTKAG